MKRPRPARLIPGYWVVVRRWGLVAIFQITGVESPVGFADRQVLARKLRGFADEHQAVVYAIEGRSGREAMYRIPTGEPTSSLSWLLAGMPRVQVFTDADSAIACAHEQASGQRYVMSRLVLAGLLGCVPRRPYAIWCQVYRMAAFLLPYAANKRPRYFV